MRVYLSHPIRGGNGKDATEQDMKDNNRIAIAAGKHWQAVLSKAFGKEVEVYIPGEHDEFVLIAYKRSYLTEEQILDVDCKILDTCDLLLALNEDCISGGMKVEIDYALEHGIPVLYVKGADNQTAKPEPKPFDPANLKKGDRVKITFNADGHCGPLDWQLRRAEQANNVAVVLYGPNSRGYGTDLGFVNFNEIIGRAD